MNKIIDTILGDLNERSAIATTKNAPKSCQQSMPRRINPSEIISGTRQASLRSTRSSRWLICSRKRLPMASVPLTSQGRTLLRSPTN